MTKLDQKVQKMVAELEKCTIWKPDHEVPGPSTFSTTYEDLDYIKKRLVSVGDGFGGTEGYPLIEIRHKNCGGPIGCFHDLSDQYVYRCNGYSTTDGWGFCPYAINDSEARKDESLLAMTLYTELPEDTEDLKEWPVALVYRRAPGYNPTGYYSTVQPIPREELLEKRVRRLLAIRGAK